MDDIPSKSPSVPATDSAGLRDEIESLRHLIGSILVLLVVISGTLTIFLLRELKSTSAQLNGFRTGATNMIAIYQKQQAPAMDEFIKRIQQYGQTHRDFDPILHKYGLKNPPSTSAAPTPATPPSNTTQKK